MRLINMEIGQKTLHYLQGETAPPFEFMTYDCWTGGVLWRSGGTCPGSHGIWHFRLGKGRGGGEKDKPRLVSDVWSERTDHLMFPPPPRHNHLHFFFSPCATTLRSVKLYKGAAIPLLPPRKEEGPGRMEKMGGHLHDGLGLDDMSPRYVTLSSAH